MDKKLKVFLGVLALLTAFNSLVSYRYLQFRLEAANFFAISLQDINDRLPEIQARAAKRAADQAAKVAEAAKPDVPKGK